MQGHELTPSGYAQTVVAACLLNGYRDDLQKELDKVLGDRNLRKYVPEDDILVLRLKKFSIAEPRNALAEIAERLKNYHSQSPVIDKAKRIVAELAKVRTKTVYGALQCDDDELFDAFEKCLSIAEEAS